MVLKFKIAERSHPSGSGGSRNFLRWWGRGGHTYEPDSYTKMVNPHPYNIYKIKNFVYVKLRQVLPF